LAKSVKNLQPPARHRPAACTASSASKSPGTSRPWALTRPALRDPARHADDM